MRTIRLMQQIARKPYTLLLMQRIVCIYLTTNDTMIPKQLTIGSLTFDSPLIQGPLAGYTCSAMRRLSWQFGGLAYTCTEMLSADRLAGQRDRSARYHHIAPDEGPVCFQISSHLPDTLAQASERACEYGATLLDLNVGCPQPKIRKKKQGSHLLSQPERLRECLAVMVRHANCPVTVKIRVDRDSGEDFNASVLEAAHEAGVAAIIVHGRHWQENYDRASDWYQIAWFVERSSVPVIGNGDLRDHNSCTAFFKHTGAAGAMISRAAMGQPWLFEQIMNGTDQQSIPLDQRIQLFTEHLCALRDLEQSDRTALLQARSFVKYYFPNESETAYKNAIYECNCLADLLSLFNTD